MNRGIYPILSGALAQEERIQVLANNIANLKTGGFKRVEPVFRSVLGTAGRLAGSFGPGAEQQPVMGGLPQGANERVFVQSINLATNFGGGQLKKTDNHFDLAVQGKGFFEIKTPQGVFYTRNGAFHLDNKRHLITENGSAVMGDKGEIVLKPGDAKVAPDGRIQVDDATVARIKLVEFPEDQPPQQIGGGLFIGQNPKPVKDITLVVGHIEESNVNSFSEMARLIEVMRSYESAQKMLTTFDKATETSIQELGRAT